MLGGTKKQLAAAHRQAMQNTYCRLKKEINAFIGFEKVGVADFPLLAYVVVCVFVFSLMECVGEVISLGA